MKIGYAVMKDGSSADVVEKRKMELDADKLFVDMGKQNDGLSEALAYARPGDILIVSDVHEISEEVGEFIRWCMKINRLGLTLVCRKQKIDTSAMEWQFILNVLGRRECYADTAFDPQEHGRSLKSRYLEELDQYILRAEAGEITVKEVCERMKIGKSTYYRRWRVIHGRGKK